MFKFDIGYSDNGPVTLFVYSNAAGEVIHDEPRHYYQLAGKAREESQKVMQTVKPREIHLEIISETNKELAGDGNMQNFKLLSTYQKAKSEQNCKYDLRSKSNHVGDLVQQCFDNRKTSDPYLQRVGILLFAMMYLKSQLHLIDSKKIWVLHLDATGSVVREPDGEECKRILYYALVARFMNSTISLAEFISPEHDTASISHFLKDYRKFLVQDGYKWPTFVVVVVDWSWVLSHGLLFEWNHMDIQTYLKIAYNCAEKNISFPRGSNHPHLLFTLYASSS